MLKERNLANTHLFLSQYEIFFFVTQNQIFSKIVRVKADILESNGKYYNDPCSLHLGIKPDKGEKWALTIWSHDKKIR